MELGKAGEKGRNWESRGWILNEGMFFHGKSGRLVVIFQ
jgi:hypothetical protein